MPRIATKLAPAGRGGFVARKVVPADVREEYAKLYGQRVEERLNTGAVPILLARAKHREWLSEIEARISNIRATSVVAPHMSAFGGKADMTFCGANVRF
jgi:hypothetical protein